METIFKKEVKIYNEFMTMIECAQILKIDPQTVRRLIKDGKLKGIVLGNKKAIRISCEDFEEFLNKKRNEIPLTIKVNGITEIKNNL